MQYKKIIVRIVLLSCLVAGMMDLINIKPGDAGRSMLALYFCIPLASLALTETSRGYVRIIGVVGTLILLAISRLHVYPILAAAVLFGGTFYSILRHETFLNRRKEITPAALAYVHSYIFCMTCAIAGSFSIMGKGKTIDIDCNEVRGYIDQHMSTVLTPLGITTGQLENIQVRVDGFFTKSTDELIQEQVTNQISNQLGSQLGVQLGGDIGGDLGANISQQLSQQLGGKSMADIVNMVKQSGLTGQQIGGKSAAEIAAMFNGGKGSGGLQIKTPDPSTLASNNPIAKKLMERAKSKQAIVAVVEDKKELDDKICNVVFDQIKTWSTLPGFGLSILVSLIFFFYPLIRLFAYFYGGFLTVIYMLLRQMGFISVVPEEKIVDTWVVGDGYVGNTILSTLAFEAKAKMQASGIVTPPAAVYKSVSKKEPSAAQIAAQNATPPQISSSSKGGNINDLLGSFESQGGGEGGNSDTHIITANSPQDTDTIEIPPAPKKSDSPHIEFGSFGGNFDKKPEKKNSDD